MDLSSGYPFWLIKNGLPYNYPFLQKNLTTDVVIIGGGISGALMLYHLLQKGISAVMIDKRTIGLGSTCASTSLLQYEIDTSLHELVEKIGTKNAIAAYKLCSDSIDKIEGIATKIGFKEFERKQSLYFAAFKKDISFLEKEFDVRKQAGFEIKFMEQMEVKNKCGFHAPAALLSKQAAQINAYNFTHELLQYSIKKGGQVYDRTEAALIKESKNGVTVKTEKGYIIKAKKLVYTTGYEVLNYIDEKFLKLKSTYAVCSEQMNEKQLSTLSGYLFWNTADPYLYMRTTADQRILIGGRDEDYYNPHKRDKLLARKTKQLTSDFKVLFPGIPFKPEFSWTGTFASTKDGLPFIGTYKNHMHSYFSLGFGGNGITFSVIAAEMITSMIQGKKSKHTDLFAFNRV